MQVAPMVEMVKRSTRPIYSTMAALDLFDSVKSNQMWTDVRFPGVYLSVTIIKLMRSVAKMQTS